jgi:His-Xaa-Ser system protein HxsD
MEAGRSQESNEITIVVSSRLYPREVIYRVCYQFTDHCYLWLEPQQDGDICVRITPKTKPLLADRIRGEFGNALIDHAVRWSVAQETAKIREVLVSTALAEAHPNVRA